MPGQQVLTKSDGNKLLDNVGTFTLNGKPTMTIYDENKQKQADARFYGALILDHRIQLLRNHGNDSTTDELLNLADSQQISIADAADIIIKEINERIATAKQTRLDELAAYDAFIEKHHTELCSLNMAAKSALLEAQRLSGIIERYPASQQAKRNRLAQDGMTTEQIDYVLSLAVGELAQLRADRSKAVAAHDAAKQRIDAIYRAAHALPAGVSHGA